MRLFFLFLFFFFFPPFFAPSFISHPRVSNPHRLLNLSGDSSASGSPLRSRLDENTAPAAAADGRMNIGLANDFVRRDELPPLDKPSRALDSDKGKNPPMLRRRKNGDFMPL